MAEDRDRTSTTVAAADQLGPRVAVAFARVLRGGGIDLPVGSTLDYAAALAAVGVERLSRVYWAGRSTTVVRPEDVPIYDRAFAAFFMGSAVAADRRLALSVPLVLDGGDEATESDALGDDDMATTPALTVRWSATEVLRHRDFAEYTPDEHAEARRLMEDMRFVGALRRSRRRRPSHHERGRPDLRRTVRRSFRSGGEPVRRAFTRPAEQRRRLVLLLDISGSMEPYSRALVRFLHAAVVARGRVEAFTLGTRLTRLTRELSSRDPDVALAAAAERAADWSGGTRLGEAMRAFNDEWGIRGIARGATVVILSDGWDRGDPATLATELQRLQRVAHRIVWVNPLKASDGYAPIARGMAAALPYVDDFVEGHSLAALDELAEVISR